MPADERPCPACGSTGVHGRYRAHDGEAIGGGPLALLHCSSCGARFQPRVPTEAELGRWYDYMGHIPVNSQPSPLIDRRVARLVSIFDDVRQTNRLLEIGCGGGVFVRAASARGWQVWGTEISPSCAALLRPQLGDRLFQGTVVEAPFEEASFDGVAMVEVIEHLADPLPYLVTVRRLLRPGGRLFMTTPNTSGASSRVLGTRWRAYIGEHLSYFDRRSMTVLLERAGFGNVGVSTSNADLVAYAWSMRPRFFPGGPSPVSVPRSTTAEAREPVAPAPAAPSRPSAATALKVTLLDAAIETVNRIVNLVGVGDTMKVIAERP